MKTYTGLVVTRLYKRVQVEVPNDTDISTVKELMLENSPEPLWQEEIKPDEIVYEVYDLFEEVEE